ncbi:hypothetical protein Golomagni_03748 [Golovinomyces magnicellulatus]|nr:hypothetical protein Golomagni_03748 [Golovinomyces magnicellulatus]
MVERPKKPTALTTNTTPTQHVQVTTSHSNSRVNATLSTGESLDILLYGATIISWKDKEGKDRLWLSDAAKLDRSKPVRGGIPLVFPVFGKDDTHDPTSKLPQHGFARISDWEYLGKTTSESGEDESVMLSFGLSPNNLSEEIRKCWPYSFVLIYSITFSQDKLTTNLLIRNDGKTTWDFKALMHTYFRVQDISDVTLTGLESLSYMDKLATPVNTVTSSSDPVKVGSKTDRIYMVENDSNTSVQILEQGKKKFEVSTDNMNEIVLWNPWNDGAANMDDFEPKDGYKEMVCVEAGSVKNWTELASDETWEGSQVIYAL